MGPRFKLRLLLTILVVSILDVRAVVDEQPPGINMLALQPECGGDAQGEGMLGSINCVIDDIMGEAGNLRYYIDVDDLQGKAGLLFTLRVSSGRADIEVQGPSTDVPPYVSRWIMPPDDRTTRFNELFIRIPANESKSGRYIMTIKGGPRADVLEDGFIFYYLRVQAAPVAELAKEDRQALFDLTKKCCQGVQSVLCQTILPKGLNQLPANLCQLGNFVCDAYGRLVKLSLGFAQFRCNLPEELAKFKQLRTLELDKSDFRGSSLDDMAKILKGTKTLERLFLRNSNIRGTIPCALFEGKNLRSLYISYNHDIVGTLPACALESKSLAELSFTATGITGTIPDVIPEGSNLRVLTANVLDRPPMGFVPETPLEEMTGLDQVTAGLSGPLPASLKNAADLRLVALPYHNISGELPELPNSLLSLQLPHCKITGTLPSKLPSSLVVLDLTNNSLTGPLPDFNSAPELGVVHLEANQLEGSIPTSFGSAARSLVQLGLAGNRLTGKVDDIKWEELTELTMLALDGNNLKGSTLPASLGGLKKLEFLSLSRTGLSGDLYAYADAIPTYPSSEQAFQQLSQNDTLNLGRKLLQGAAQEAPTDEPAAAAPAPAAAKPAAASQPAAAAAEPAPAAAAAGTAAPAPVAAAASTPTAATSPARSAPADSAPSDTKTAPAAAVTTAAAAPAVDTKAAAPTAATTTSAAATVEKSTAAAPAPAAAPGADQSVAAAAAATQPAGAATTTAAAAAAGDAEGQGSQTADPTTATAGDQAVDPSANAAAAAPPLAGPGQQRTFPTIPEDAAKNGTVVGHMLRPAVDQGALPRDNSMRPGDTAAASDYWRNNNEDMIPPPERPNSLLHVDLSNNQLTGTIPQAIFKMNMFADLAIAKDPRARREFVRSLDLSDNKLQGVFPTELLLTMASLSYGCASPDCRGMVNLSGNELYCPENSSIQAVKDSLASQDVEWQEAAAFFAQEDCIVPGKPERYNLSEYLTQPSDWVDSVPSFAARSSSSGGARGPSAGVIAGTVIGVLAAVVIIVGLIVWGVKRVKGRPMSYRKDGVPDYAVNVVGPQGTAAGVV